MRYFLFFLGAILFNTNLYALGYCSAYEDSEGTLDYSSLGSDWSDFQDCQVAPDVYQIVLYEVGFCSSQPTAPSTSSGFDSSSGDCTALFSNSNGESLDLAVGVSLNVSENINIPNGTYTHGYVIMKNTFGIKATKTFADSNLIRTTNGSSSGNICWSAADPIYGSSYYATDHDSSVFAAAYSFVECGATAGTAEIITDTLDAFEVNSGVGTYTASASVTGGTIYAYLTRSTDDFKLVNAINTADRIVAIMDWTSAVSINEQTSSIDIQFNVSGGTSLQIWSPASGYTIDLGGFSSGPFSATIVAN